MALASTDEYWRKLDIIHEKLHSLCDEFSEANKEYMCYLEDEFGLDAITPTAKDELSELDKDLRRLRNICDSIDKMLN